MTLINLMPDMAAERADAIAKVDAHFNRLALENLHRELVYLALAERGGLISREQRRQEFLGLIALARTPAEISEILSSL